MDYDEKPNTPWERLAASVVLIALACALPRAAFAQAFPPPQPEAVPQPAAPRPAAPDASEQPSAPLPSETAPAPEPTTPVETFGDPVLVPATEQPGPGEDMPQVLEQPPQPPVSVSAWTHLTMLLHDFDDPEKLDELTQQAELNLFFSAPITEHIAFAADLFATYGPTPDGGDMTGTAGILDLIAKLDFADPFHVWIGRMLVPSDRQNFSGVWFASPWFYPGLYVPFEAPVGPRQGPNGRNDGLTVWGDFGGGVFKYYASAFNLHDRSNTTLFSGRLNLSLISPEPGFYHNASYLGGKEILAIGVGAQYQKDGFGADDYSEIHGDVLFEHNLGGAGTISLEGALYKYMGEGRLIDMSYYALASYLTPGKLGVGQLQPLLRIQQARPEPDGLDTWTLIDAQLGYFVSGFAARFAVGFQRSDAPLTTMPAAGGGIVNATGNTVYFGTQLQI